jgi:hypothetical protein
MPGWWSIVELARDTLGVMTAVVSLVATLAERRRGPRRGTGSGEEQ